MHSTGDNYDNSTSLHFINKHCSFCSCGKCICFGQNVFHNYSLEELTPYWDNPCLGSCLSCSTYYEP